MPGEALAQVANRSCGCIQGGIQGQAGCSRGHPELVVGDPVYGSGAGTRWSLRPLSTQAVL